MSRITRRLAVATSALAAAGTLSVAVVPTAEAAHHHRSRHHVSSSCHVRWGSKEKGVNLSSTVSGTRALGVRTGHHGCYDRVVFDLDGQPGKTAAIYAPGKKTGMQVLAVGATTHLVPAGVKAGDVLPTRYRTVRGVVYGGSTKGVDAVGLVLRGRLPYRVFLLKGPGGHNRVVVDVAHRW